MEEEATANLLSLQETAQRLAELATYLRDLAQQPLPGFLGEASEEHCAAAGPEAKGTEDR